jgi:hypothetical protein
VLGSLPAGQCTAVGHARVITVTAPRPLRLEVEELCFVAFLHSPFNLSSVVSTLNLPASGRITPIGPCQNPLICGKIPLAVEPTICCIWLLSEHYILRLVESTAWVQTLCDLPFSPSVCCSECSVGHYRRLTGWYFPSTRSISTPGFTVHICL